MLLYNISEKKSAKKTAEREARKISEYKLCTEFTEKQSKPLCVKG